jgi:small-conductance mechanosensitive channel
MRAMMLMQPAAARGAPAGWLGWDGWSEAGWLGPLAAMAVLLTLATVVHALVFGLLRRAEKKRRTLADVHLLRKTRWPVLWFVWLFAVLMVAPTLPLDDAIRERVLIILRALIIAALTWALIGAVSVIDDIVEARNDVNVRDNLRARRLRTRARVLVRTAMVLIGVTGAAAFLMSFPSVRQVGVGLLASAGVAGLALGIAAKPTLGNLIAGLQIALTEPVNLGDAVVVEGEWGWVEEITATYLVIKIWDQRRLIVPLEHFINNPFQNWTRTRADLIGAVTLHTDYSVPVDALRAELQRITAASTRWDKRVCVLQVIDTTPTTMILRALVSAEDSPTAWDLRCEVREALLGFLAREHPNALPRTRAEVGVGVGVGLDTKPPVEARPSEPRA